MIVADKIIHHRNTDALSENDRDRIWFTYISKLRGRFNPSDLQGVGVTIHLVQPPELEPGFWNIDEIPSPKIITDKIVFRSECLGYRHQNNNWEWWNIYADFKDIRICIDAIRYNSRHKRYNDANQF